MINIITTSIKDGGCPCKEVEGAGEDEEKEGGGGRQKGFYHPHQFHPQREMIMIIIFTNITIIMVNIIITIIIIMCMQAALEDQLSKGGNLLSEPRTMIVAMEVFFPLPLLLSVL